MKGIIFDLDNCILDSRCIPFISIYPILAPLYRSNLPDRIKVEVSKSIRINSLRDVLKLFDIPQDIAIEMHAGNASLRVPDDLPLKTFGDEGILKDILLTKILVTSGYKLFQGDKIARLGLEEVFDEIIIDANDDISQRKGKEKIFKEILELRNWHPSEVRVVGDNPNSELKAAKSLGIKAVQTLRPGIIKWDKADYHIKSFKELLALL